MEAASMHWNRFLHRCLENRISPAKFGVLAKALQRKLPPSGYKIAKILVNCQTPLSVDTDPLASFYVEQLLNLNLIDGQDILLSIHRRYDIEESTSRSSLYNGFGSSHLIEFEDAILNVLFRAYTQGTRPSSENELQKTLEVLSDRISALASANARAMMSSDVFHQIGRQELYLRETFGILLVAILENSKVMSVSLYHGIIIDAASTIFWAGNYELKILEQAKHVAQSLSAFISTLAEHAVPLANRLDALRQSYAKLQLELPPDGSNDSLVMTQLELDGFMETPNVRSRAGLFIYLDVLLSERPLTNDAFITSYLEARYKGDVQSLSVDLVVASFDLLTAATQRGESVRRSFLVRSFMANKLPLLLQSMAAMSFMPVNFGFVFQQAFGRLGPSSFQAFSQDFGFDNHDRATSEARKHLLSACVIYGLVSQEVVAVLLGNQSPQSAPVVARLSKDTLVAEYASDSRKLERLVIGMEGMDGNVSTIAEALIEILHNLWASRDTISLKTFCNLLYRRHHALDAMLLFINPSSLVFPLCQLIDNWKYEDDQGEYQPVYDEFSSCLLLVLAIYYRYNLSTTEMGLDAGHSFILRLLESGANSQSPGMFSQTQEKQFTGWIHALFESEAISDDLMSTCPPQDFYDLIPTIFEQSLNACRKNIMSIETLKDGLELLLETFLLPSLIPALQWLAKHSWQQQGEADLIVQVLQKLTSPASLHGEGAPMHSTILDIVGTSLTSLLHDLRHRDPSRQDIGPLLEKLTPHLDYSRSIPSQHVDPQSWSVERNAGVLISLKQSIAALCYWSSPMTMSTQSPTYTYKDLYLVVKLVGAVRALDVIIEECTSQSETGLGDYALDVATALICADWLYQTGTQYTMSLRSATSLAAQDSKLDATKRSIVLKLIRRVEAQLAGVQIAPSNVQIVMPDIIPELVAEPAQQMVMSEDMAPVQMDFHPIDDDLQMDLSNLGHQASFGSEFGNLLGGNEDDIFDGLALDDDVDI